MNEITILKQARNLIVNENWSVRRICKKFGVTRAWLRGKLETLEDKVLNDKLKNEEPVNEAAVALPNESVSLVAPVIEFDDVIQFGPSSKKEDNIKIEALINYRIIHGLNMKQFAKKCGLDPSTISKLEKNNRQMGEKTKRFILAGTNLTLEEFNAYADKKPIGRIKVENKSNLETENETLLKANTELQTENYTLNKKLEAAKDTYKLIAAKDEEIALLKNDINAMKGTIKKLVEERNSLVKKVAELENSKNIIGTSGDLDKLRETILKQAREIKRLNKVIDKLVQ